MCSCESEGKRRLKMGSLKGGERVEKLKNSRMKLWMIRATTSVLLWTCIVQLTALGETWGPRVLKGWPSCLYHPESSSSIVEDQVPSIPALVLPPKRVYKNNGYLMVSCNGGLNQMRAAICDMVTIARYLNVTLIVTELAKTSFWADPSEFQDIFDVDHFINSLRDEVRILRELPPRLKRRVEMGRSYSMPPISWSDISYYHNQVSFSASPLFQFFIYELAKLECMLGGLVIDFVYEVVTLFFEDADKLINSIARALEQLQQGVDCFAQVDSSSHQLKGSSSSVGAKRVKDVCFDLRTYCEARNYDRCLGCLQQLTHEYSLFKAKLQTLFKVLIFKTI